VWKVAGREDVLVVGAGWVGFFRSCDGRVGFVAEESLLAGLEPCFAWMRTTRRVECCVHSGLIS